MIADHIGEETSRPFTNKVYDYRNCADGFSLKFHVLRKTSNEPSGSDDLFISSSKNYDLKTLLELKRGIEQAKPDTLHITSTRGLLYTVLAKTLWYPDVKILARVASTVFRECWLYNRLFQALQPKIDTYLAPCNHTRKKLVHDARVNPERVAIHYNFTSLDRFDPTEYTPEKERYRMKIPEDTTVIGYIGRLRSIKNVAAIIRAVDRLSRDEPIHLRIIGDGPLRDDLEKLANRLGIGDQVTFLGYRNDIPAQISACDATALATDYESFGMPVIESLAMETPIVSTNVGIAQDIPSVPVYDCPTPDNIAGALRRVLSDPERFTVDREGLRQFDIPAYFVRLRELADLHSSSTRVSTPTNTHN